MRYILFIIQKNDLKIFITITIKMSKGFVLLFNKKETESGYPYINLYNLIQVEVDIEEWDDDPYIVLSRSPLEISIGSWEETKDYQGRIQYKINRLNLTGKFLHIDSDGLYEIFDADTQKFIPLIDNQEKITHNLGEFLSSLFLHFP